MKGWQTIFGGVLAVALCWSVALASPELDLGARVFHLESGVASAPWSGETLRGIAFQPHTFARAQAPRALAPVAFGIDVDAPSALAPVGPFSVTMRPLELRPLDGSASLASQSGAASDSLVAPASLQVDVTSLALPQAAFATRSASNGFFDRIVRGLARVRTNVELNSPQSPRAGSLTAAPPASDQVLGGQAKFALRAGSRSLSVALSSRYEHLSRGLIETSGTLPALNPLGLDSTTRLSLPPAAFNDLSRSSLGASLAMPVSDRFTVGVGYRSGRVIGTFGSFAPTTIDANDSRVFGRLTYTLPNAPAAITFQARQYRYTDNLGMTPNQTQLRAGVDLTIKF
ncbi:MAG TPA: hypothetical protein VMV73_01885 [Candidatus Dormibacteraeota bacterium]|nr:hypothetical protein [Candidatus Dormibacteraeota bacterium]